MSAVVTAGVTTASLACRRALVERTFPLLAPQGGDGAGEPRTFRVGQIELIPTDDISAFAFETEDEAYAKAQTFQESRGSDYILADEPGVAAALGSEFLHAAQTAVIRRMDFAPDETIQADAGTHRAPGSRRIHARTRFSAASTAVSLIVRRTRILAPISSTSAKSIFVGRF